MKSFQTTLAAYIILGVGLAFALGATGYAIHKLDYQQDAIKEAHADQHQDLIAACQRGNELRLTIQHTNNILGNLVKVSIPTLNDPLKEAFKAGLDKLYKQVPLVDCQTEYEIP